VREAAARFSVSYESMRSRLMRLAKRGVLEKRMVGRVAMYCVKDGAPPKRTSPKRRIGLKTAQRAERVAELLAAEGCMSASALMQALGLRRTSLRHVLMHLMSQGRVVELVVGGTAIWCRDRGTAEELAARLRETAHRLASRGRYVMPSRLLRAVQKDGKAYALFSKFIPLSRFAEDHLHPVALSFANAILKSLYGEPTVYSLCKHVYLVSSPRQDLGGIAIRDKTSRAAALPPDLAAASEEDARRRGVSAEEVVAQTVQQLQHR
jgi:hypothetical protein